jgi:Pyridoxamine 5'-phosphate oxidase
MPTLTAGRVTEMSVAECLVYLGAVGTGRLAVTHRALPYVVPVHIGIVDNKVLVQSYLGDRIPLRPGVVVALEAGTFGDATLASWTVLVRGFLAAPGTGRTPAIGAQPSEPPETFFLSIEFVTGWRQSG